MLGVADQRQTQRSGEVADQSLIVVVGDGSGQYAGRHRVGLGNVRRTLSTRDGDGGGRITGTATVRRLRRGVTDVTERRRRHYSATKQTAPHKG